MNSLVIDNKYKFLCDNKEEAQFVFSTANNSLDFNINKEEGISNLEKIKTWFGVEEVYYLKQIHSDLIYNYDSEIHQGDAVICNKRKVAIGVFTADCVPILLYDKNKKVFAAVHSGWRGTLSNILGKTIDKMRQEYGTNAKDIIVYIGPHNRVCCYEIGEEVKEKFLSQNIYEKDIFQGRNLDIKKCLLYQLENKKILKENIFDLNICTYCDKEYELHSYRRDKDKAGRMFSFIFIK